MEEHCTESGPNSKITKITNMTFLQIRERDFFHYYSDVLRKNGSVEKMKSFRLLSIEFLGNLGLISFLKLFNKEPASSYEEAIVKKCAIGQTC